MCLCLCETEYFDVNINLNLTTYPFFFRVHWDGIHGALLLLFSRGADKIGLRKTPRSCFIANILELNLRHFHKKLYVNAEIRAFHAVLIPRLSSF